MVLGLISYVDGHNVVQKVGCSVETETYLQQKDFRSCQMLDAAYLWLMSMQEEILMDMIRSGRSQEILSLVMQNLTDERFLDLESQYNVG